MRTGIVILNYNDYETTLNLINNIKDYKEIDLIIVVDNNSLDNSYVKLKEFENDKIKVIKTMENKGYAYGNNIGLKYLEDKNIDYVIISNPDVVFSENTIKELKKDLSDDKVTMVAPVIYQNNSVLRGWKLPHFKEDLISNFNYFYKYANKMLEYSDSYYNKRLVSVDVVSGCFFIIKYDRFRDIDYFDQGTFLYYEENILGKKLKEKKYLSYVDLSINVKHELSVSVNKSFNSLKKYKILKNSQLYYEKKYNKLNIFGLFLLKITYYMSYIVSYIYLKLKGVKK